MGRPRIKICVTSIGDAAFYGCENLMTVNYKGTKKQWKQINIENNSCLTRATINYEYSSK
ncbi:MAG: hypothetical protein IKA37_05835 [Spirochaetales bacterium]|nr:hypothetical protein [Spirochaetales bacterium]